MQALAMANHSATYSSDGLRVARDRWSFLFSAGAMW